MRYGSQTFAFNQFEMDETYICLCCFCEHSVLTLLLCFFRWVNCQMKREICSLWRTRPQWEAAEQPGAQWVPSITERHIREASISNSSTSTEKWSKLNLMESAKMCLTFCAMFWSPTLKLMRLKCFTWKCVATTIAIYANLPLVTCKFHTELSKLFLWDGFFFSFPCKWFVLTIFEIPWNRRKQVIQDALDSYR